MALNNPLTKLIQLNDVTITSPVNNEPVVYKDAKYINSATIASTQINAKDANGLKLYEDSNLGIFIKDGGNVGINTSNPGEKLQVVGNASLGIGSTNVAGSGYVMGITGIASKATDGNSPILSVFSNDALASNPLMLSMSLKTSPTATSRYAEINCSEYGTGAYRTIVINRAGGNVNIGTTSYDTVGSKVLTIGSGSQPTTSIAGGVQLYSAEQITGNACLHTRTENGSVIRLYQTQFVANAKVNYTTGELDTEAKIIAAINATNTTINAILSRLIGLGFMEPA